MALSSATKGRLRPSFFLLIGACTWVQAQTPVGVVYRCGQQYTNAPQDLTQCQALSPQAVTVIEGTRVQHPASPRTVPEVVPAPRAGASEVPAMPVTGVASTKQRQRDDTALAVLRAELVQARERHVRLQQEPPQASVQERAQHQAALERTQRDIDSLQRELQRRFAGATAP
jgi:hypothetical protein